jgi:hypothetical protein
MLRLAGQAPSRFRPLSSNVRQHHVALKVLAIASGAAVAAEYQTRLLATALPVRHEQGGHAQVPPSAHLLGLLSSQRFAATNLSLSIRFVQSVSGAAATRNALPSFTAGGGGGLNSPGASSPRWRIGGQYSNPMPWCFGL